MTNSMKLSLAEKFVVAIVLVAFVASSFVVRIEFLLIEYFLMLIFLEVLTIRKNLEGRNRK